MNLLYEESEGDPARPRGGRTFARAASLAAAAFALAGIGAGYFAAASGQPDAAITGAVAPFVAALLLASALL